MVRRSPPYDLSFTTFSCPAPLAKWRRARDVISTQCVQYLSVTADFA